jgi:hypothetical protein
MANRYLFIEYEEAQKLIPFFRRAKTSAPYKEAREAAGRILLELNRVRGDIEYDITGGHQIMVSERDYQFLEDVMEALGVR